MALDPKSPQAESQKDYQKRVQKSYALNNLEPPFPWKVQAFNPFTFRLHLVSLDKLPTGEQFAEGVSEFFSGGTVGGGAAGTSFFG